MSSQSDPLIGQVLHDTHRVVRLLGKGGMGTVYEAEHVRLRGQRFAVKVLPRAAREDEVQFRRFRREAEISSLLRHPGIVAVVDFYRAGDGRPCMVMEYLEGEDLEQRLCRGGRLSAAVTARIMEQVGGALAAAHQRGIVHRDLKPANIFLLGEPGSGVQVKLLDFGIARVHDSLMTRSDAVMGTPYYMAPEQARGLVDRVDPRTDIFSLGAIAYQALAGRRPFRGGHFVEVLQQVCTFVPPPLHSLDPAIPEEAGRVVARAMAKERDARQATVSEFVDGLLAALADLR